MTDGVWIWPGRLWHYVRDHNVRLPDEFVTHMAEQSFLPPEIETTHLPTGTDASFWLHWSAQHTQARIAPPDACSLDQAQAICEQLTTKVWAPSVLQAHGRWQISFTGPEGRLVDFTEPLPKRTLQSLLFAHRVVTREEHINTSQANAIAKRFDRSKWRTRVTTSARDRDGNIWWAILIASPEGDAIPIKALSLADHGMPTPGYAIELPGNYRLEAHQAMDSIAWQWLLKQEQRLYRHHKHERKRCAKKRRGTKNCPAKPNAQPLARDEDTQNLVSKFSTQLRQSFTQLTPAPSSKK